MAIQESLSRRLVAVLLVVIAPMLAACHVQWVSPYSAVLQNKATDMLSDVVAWESHMRSVAGTAAADPRDPDVQAKFASWRGTIEAMEAIEVSIDPGSTVCNRILGAIGRGVQDELKKLPNAPPTVGSPTTQCETLPDILAKMAAQVAEIPTGAGGATTASHSMLVVLDQQCKVPWLSDQYFTALQGSRATAPLSTSTKAGAPTPSEQGKATEACRSLFVPETDATHGDLVSALVIELESIIYREGREAASGSK